MSKRKIRVRSKRLEQIDEGKMWLALHLMARGIVEDKTATPPSPIPLTETRADEERS
jgi:hypothetical protein